MLLCGPENVLASRMQTLKLPLGKSSTHTTKASWASFETWWLAVTNIDGAVEEFYGSKKVQNLKICKILRKLISQKKEKLKNIYTLNDAKQLPR